MNLFDRTTLAKHNQMASKILLDCGTNGWHKDAETKLRIKLLRDLAISYTIFAHV